MKSRQRPPIPSELRRLVLVEAGHRCAIHTCRSEVVDIHHIEGWASTREHRLENLIALCPNCHRRADRGEIDRKSLRLYKVRLTAPWYDQKPAVYPLEDLPNRRFAWSDPGGRWRELALKDAVPEHQYVAEVEYPEFAVVGPGLALFNLYVEEKAKEIVSRFRSEALNRDLAEGHEPRLGYELNGSFSVTFLTESFASVRFAFYSSSGGAHGSHWTVTCNATLRPFSTLSLRTLFSDVALGLALLSDCCIHDLLQPQEDGRVRDDEWVRTGGAAEERNFEKFNLTPTGLLISFDDYHVGPYAEGPVEVLVPYAAIQGALADPASRLATGDA